MLFPGFTPEMSLMKKDVAIQIDIATYLSKLWTAGLYKLALRNN